MDTPIVAPDSGHRPQVSLDQFLVPGDASLQERRPRTLKHGDTFAVFDHHGDAVATAGGSEGIYHCDTRYLSHLVLTLDGARPMLLSSTMRDDNAALTCDLTNPDYHDATGLLTLSHGRIHIRRSRFLWNNTSFERVAVRNFSESAIHIRLSFTFGADFADLFEVRGTTRPHRGMSRAPAVEGDRVDLAYTGLDAKLRRTRLRFAPPPHVLAGDEACFLLDLAPGATRFLFVEIACEPADGAPPPGRAFSLALRDARRALRRESSRAASIASSNEILDEAVRRGVSDIYMLVTESPEGPYPYAGIPWFSTVFGRDGLITALEMLWMDPQIARGVLSYLAGNQAMTDDPAADAEPGKILHEVRRGEMAELGEVPFRRYYGSIDSTPLFVLLAGAYLDRTGDVVLLRRIWPNIEAAVAWIDRYGDRDGDGFVEYGRRRSDGLINQGWKDSHDSIFHADGALAHGPIALAEVQAYVYGAKRAAAAIARRLGEPTRGTILDGQADTLRRRFDEAFFDPALGTYVLALDGDKRACRVRASNAGHALYTGIAYDARAASVVASLMSGPSFSGWGVRTLAATEARYNPMSYHNGSVWPHDNALIAAGFARYGFRQEAARVFEGLFAASIHIDLRRLPELFCGFRRQRGSGPTSYPVACSPQAWAAAAPFALIQACLGLGFDVDAGQVTFDCPVMPSFVDHITIRQLSVGEASVDVELQRTSAGIVVNTLSATGNIHVVTTT